MRSAHACTFEVFQGDQNPVAERDASGEAAVHVNDCVAGGTQANPFQASKEEEEESEPSQVVRSGSLQSSERPPDWAGR